MYTYIHDHMKSFSELKVSVQTGWGSKFFSDTGINT